MDYGAAHETVLRHMAELANAEMPGHPDLKPPEGPELEPEYRGVFVVAYINGQPAASGGYRTFPGDPTAETAEFVRMYVRPGARRSGVGRALLAELEELAREDDYRYALLEVGAEQRGAQALYEIRGYRRIPNEGDKAGRHTYLKVLPTDDG
ncbi:MAG TPA: GNAT family N-acetyltransferase [Pseudonocardia sp.]|nr:GNAT family N-acetyltransferase [Pseudonocardia sp.]